MYCLTEEQIEYILNDIRRRGVEMEDLQLNLLDHICCIIEQELEKDGDFENFYQHTITQFYKKELCEIEEETIHLLTFKNYYAMKRLMFYSGISSVITFFIGSVFKIMSWPGAGVLLLVATVVFSFLFIPVVFLLKTKEVNSQRDKWILRIGTVVGILYCLSTLFLVFLWPGARVIWFSTLFISLFVFVPVYFFTGIRRPEAKTNTIVITILLVGYLGMQFTMTAIKTSPQMLGRVYTYLQSEALLAEAINSTAAADTTVNNIQSTCERLKTYILKYDMGISSIPYNFEEQGIAIKELNAGFLLEKEEGKRLLLELKDEVNAYNRLHPERSIPLTFSILDSSFVDRNFCSNLFVLTNIAQLQLYLTASEKAGAKPLAYN
jgi:hypothetical protein